MKNKLISKIGILFFGVLITYSYIQFKKDESDLKKSKIILNAKITGHKLTKSTLLIAYIYICKQTAYDGIKSAKALESKDVNQFLLNKTFPLILSPTNPKNNELLLFKEDFEKYGLVYPDSLKWVCDSLKLKDCK